jgi:GNAT superfamily N-acetyltransferase
LDEVAEFHRLSGRAFVAMAAEAPGLEVRLTRNCALALSGEDVADLNMLFLGPGPEAEQFLVDAMARVGARELPLLVIMAPSVAPALAPAAERLGLTAAGTIPLMVLSAPADLPTGRECVVRQPIDPEAVATAGDLVAAAFELPRDCVARALDASLGPTSAAATYVAFDGEMPKSCVTVTRAGSTAGVWSMATPPEHQGKGMGRALLTRVLNQLRRDGVERFYLYATEAGRPLYESLGFVNIANQAVWVRGHSTQTHG